MNEPVIDLSVHHQPQGISDRIAFGFTKALRWTADTFFAERYGHRAVVLETVAAVPGMVGATINHLHCLRRMCDDKGWICTLMDEAENERMHLMTFIEISKPTLFERAVIIGVQWVFYCFFFGLYLISSKTAHRVVGYFEEEAVISYTHYLAEINEGRSENDRRRRLQSVTGGLPTMRGFAMSSWLSGPTKHIIATSTTASQTSWLDCRQASSRNVRRTRSCSHNGNMQRSSDAAAEHLLRRSAERKNLTHFVEPGDEGRRDIRFSGAR